jgi:hypothetical protein
MFDLYTQEDCNETLAAQGGISDGVRSEYGNGAIKCGLDSDVMVGLGGLEPPTSPLSVLRSLVPQLAVILAI